MTTTTDAVEALATAWGQFRYDNSVRLLRDYGDESVPVRITGKIFAEKMFSSLLSQGFTITRTEPAPVGFDAAIKQLGEPDVATGHWSLDEGNLRWFVGQCRAEPTPKVEMPDGIKYTPAQQAVWDWWCEHQKAPPVCDDLNNLVWQLDKLKQDTAMSEAELISEMREAMRLKEIDKNLAALTYAVHTAKKYRG